MQRRQSSICQEDVLPAAEAVADLRQRLARRESLGRSVQAALEQMIESGALKPGARLNEMELATQLGVSRGPVREAARALERRGLVTVILNRGAFVRSLDIDEILQTYEMNAVLFGHAAALLARGVAAPQDAELKAILLRMDKAVAEGARDAFFAANMLFHKQIVEFCGNQPLRDVYLEHTRKLLVLRRRSFDTDGNMHTANLEHHRLLDAILQGQPEQARHYAEAHTRAGRVRYLHSIAHASAAVNSEHHGRKKTSC